MLFYLGLDYWLNEMISFVSTIYELVKPFASYYDIYSFLQKYPKLSQYLLDCQPIIKQYFGEDVKVKIELVSYESKHYEIIGNVPINIKNYSVEDPIELFDKFSEEVCPDFNFIEYFFEKG